MSTVARLASTGLLALVGIEGASAQAPEWTLFEESTIEGNITGAVRNGHIFRTSSGNIYEVTDYVYLYEYEYRPDVMVLRTGSVYRLIIEGFDDDLLARRLNEPRDDQGATASTGRTPPVIESIITNDFDGLDQGNIYVLANGQVWEQVEPWIWIWIWVGPRVTIVTRDGISIMKVENIDHAVAVRRLQ